jgi:hypothetical protein
MTKLSDFVCLLVVTVVLSSCGAINTPPQPPNGGTGGPSITETHIEAVEERTAITADGMYNGAGSVAKLSDGAWFLTYGKGTSHIGETEQASRISTDQGKTWSPEVTQPVALATPAYSLPYGKYVRDTPQGYLSSVADDPIVPVFNRSTDDGTNWSAYTSFGFPTNGGVSTMAFFDGLDMYMTAYFPDAGIGAGNSAFLLKSSDDGITWSMVSAIRAIGDAAINETGVCKVGPTRIMAISRSDSETATYVKFSDDMGLTWGPQIDYTSQVSVLQLPQILNMGSFLVLVARDGRHNRMVGFTSNDNGLTFEGKIVLDTYTGNYIDGGYSWLLPMNDGRVFVTFYSDTNNLQKPDIKSVKLRFATH